MYFANLLVKYNNMEKYIYLLFLGFLPLAFSCCGASKLNEDKVFQTKPPFEVVQSTYHTWVGGQPEVKGLRIEIEIGNSEIELDTVFFRNMKTKLKKDMSSNADLYIGTFVFPQKNEFKFHMDPEKEYGNIAPDIRQKIPFQLKKDEAVISYTYKSKLKFYKLEHLIETKSSSIKD